jgi:hypothetical protein
MCSLSTNKGKYAICTSAVAAILFLFAVQTHLLIWNTPVASNSNEDYSSMLSPEENDYVDDFALEESWKEGSFGSHPIVKKSDIIMSKPLHTNPIVVEEYKLIFFPVPKVGCSEWKLLLRRMMGFTKGT